MGLVHTAALKYTLRGWNPIPVDKASKRPLIKWEEFQTRKVTENEINSWPDCNIGIVTGAISGITVIDVDSDSPSLYPSAVSVKTRRGYHRYFQYHPQAKTVAGVQDKVDIRSDGGFVIVPPSAYQDAEYKWLSPYTLPLPRFPDNILSNGYPDKPLVVSRDWIGEALSSLTPDCHVRDQTFTRIIGRLLRDGHSPETIKQLLLPKATEVDFKGWELDKCINSVMRYPNQTTVSQLWIPGDNFDEYEKELNERSQQRKASVTTGFKAIDDKIIELPRQELTTCAAPSGYGKTSFAITVGEFLRRSGKRVLYFSNEMRKKRILDKFLAVGASIPFSELVTGNLSESSAKAARAYKSSLQQNPIAIFDPEVLEINEVRNKVEQFKPDLFIYDNLNYVESDWIKLREHEKQLKQLCIDQNIPALLLVQLQDPPRNRDGELVDNQRSDVRGGQWLIHDAGVFLFWQNHGAPHGDIQRVKVKIAKGRYGGMDEEVILQVDKRYGRYEDIP